MSSCLTLSHKRHKSSHLGTYDSQSSDSQRHLTQTHWKDKPVRVICSMLTNNDHVDSWPFFYFLNFWWWCQPFMWHTKEHLISLITYNLQCSFGAFVLAAFWTSSWSLWSRWSNRLLYRKRGCWAITDTWRMIVCVCLYLYRRTITYLCFP